MRSSWRCAGRRWPSRAGDWVVSVQLLDAAGRLVAQHDAPPAGGDYPTSAWRADEVVLDRHRLALPANLPPGEYTVALVVYAQQGRPTPAGAGGDSLRADPRWE